MIAEMVEANSCPTCGGETPCGPCSRNVCKPGTSRTDSRLTAVLPVGTPPDQEQVDSMLRSRGYDPAEWQIVSLAVNQWESLRRRVEDKQVVNDPVVLSQTKAVLQRVIPDDQTDWARFLRGLGAIVERKPLAGGKPLPEGDRLFVCLGDDQAPFVNWPLHELTCEALSDLQPQGMVYMGDGVDFGRLTRFRKDGTRWDTSVQEDLNCLHRILSERALAANLGPGDPLFYLWGNHEDRINQELRSKLPALLGVKQAGEGGAAVLSIQHLARLDALGYQTVTDGRGDYLYGKVQLTPDLTVTHGATVRQGAGNSVLAAVSHFVGSLVCGHTHRLAVTHVTRWSGEREQVQTLGETGTMADLEGLGYTRWPDWQPGWLTALIRPDGTHHLELAVYRDGVLRWRDRQWALKGRKVRRSHP